MNGGGFMKINFKSMAAGCVIGASVMSAVPAVGYDGVRTIQAVFKNIRICVDGVEMTPRDTAGKEVEPFIYNGTTYLPVRAVGEAVGKEVSYDVNTNTVYLGDGTNTSATNLPTRGINLEPYKTENASVKNVTMGGVSYSDALWLDSGTGSGIAYYNLAGGYTSLSGMYGFDDGANEGNTATISFYGDGILIQKINVKSGQLPKNFTINLTGVSQLVIEGAHVNDTLNNWVALGDIYFSR